MHIDLGADKILLKIMMACLLANVKMGITKIFLNPTFFSWGKKYIPLKNYGKSANMILSYGDSLSCCVEHVSELSTQRLKWGVFLYRFFSHIGLNLLHFQVCVWIRISRIVSHRHYSKNPWCRNQELQWR